MEKLCRTSVVLSPYNGDGFLRRTSNLQINAKTGSWGQGI